MINKAWTDRKIGEGVEPVDQLLFHPDNPKIHPTRQTNAVKSAIRELGWMAKIKINKRTSPEWGSDQGVDVVIDGHDRIKAAAQDNQDTVPVEYYDLTPNEERLFLLTYDPIGTMFARDRETTERLLKDVATGEEELMSFLAQEAEDLGIVMGEPVEPKDAEPQTNRADELREKWGVETGQVWELGNHRLFVGDCRNHPFPDVPTNLIFDPPWDGGFGVPDGDWENILAFSDGQRIGDVINLLGSPTWLFVWDCVTSWYTPNRPLKRHKSCLWYGEIGGFDFNGAHYGEPLEASTVKNSRGEYNFVPDSRGKHLSDVFKESITKTHANGASHAKPVDWVRLLIGDCCGGDIYDPFVGTGTSLVACEQLGFKCVGCEIDPLAAAVIIQLANDLGLNCVEGCT